MSDQGKLPKPTKIGKRKVGFRPGEVAAAIAALGKVGRGRESFVAAGRGLEVLAQFRSGLDGGGTWALVA